MSALRTGLALFLAAAVITFGSTAQAGGYALVPRGARALGMGGALVAGATDLTAAWLNPAVLANLRGVHVLADIGIGYWWLGFDRAPDPAVAPGGFSRVENMAPLVASPSVFLGWDFGLDWLQATLGFYGPYAGDLGFDSMGPQRYSLVYLDMFEATYQIALAARPFPWLAIGAAFQIRDVRMTQAVKATAYTGFDALSPRESISDDIFTEIEVAGHFNPTGLIGIWVAPADWVNLGLAVQLPTWVRAPGTLRVVLPSDNPLLRNAWVDGDRVTALIEGATVVRAGFGLRLPYRLNVEVDTWAEIWEIHREVRIQVHDVFVRNVEGRMDLAMGDMSMAQNWHTSFGAAAGLEWEAIEGWLHVRTGLFYDSGAMPDETVSVAWFDSHKIGVGLGLTLDVWRLSFDVGYGHVFFVPRTVTNSIMRQINPIEPQEPELQSVVGNGTYDSALDIIAVSVRASFLDD